MRQCIGPELSKLNLNKYIPSTTYLENFFHSHKLPKFGVHIVKYIVKGVGSEETVLL